MPVAAVVQLIAFAYDVKLSRVIGLPASISGSYEVSAKAADDFPLLSFDENRKQVRLMVRQMLADRFGLRLHTEFRQETVLKMSVDPGGLRLAESSAPLPSPTRDRPTNLGMSDRGGRMIGRKATMKDIALSAGTLLRQEVVDTTGLTGQYDFDIRWTAPSVPNAPPPSPTLGPDGMALFMTAMKDQFGLRFSKSNEQVQYLIVDRITPPAEN
jgi:uncharacterized protein (TIGR03435 family)